MIHSLYTPDLQLDNLNKIIIKQGCDIYMSTGLSYVIIVATGVRM